MAAVTGVIGAGALALVGCSSSDEPAAAPTTLVVPAASPAPVASEAPTTTMPTTTMPATTTTMVTVTTSTTTTVAPPAGSTAPPATGPDGDPDWRMIVEDLERVLHRLRENPDPDRVEEYCATGENPCQASQGAEVRKMAEDGWRLVGMSLPVVESAALVAEVPNLESEQRIVIIRAVIEEPDMSDAYIFGPDGETLFKMVVEDADGLPSRNDVMLVSLATGEWRVVKIGAAAG